MSFAVGKRKSGRLTYIVKKHTPLFGFVAFGVAYRAGDMPVHVVSVPRGALHKSVAWGKFGYNFEYDFSEFQKRADDVFTEQKFVYFGENSLRRNVF